MDGYVCFVLLFQKAHVRTGYGCNLCPCVYGSYAGLTGHLSRSHKVQLSKVDVRPEENAKEKQTEQMDDGAMLNDPGKDEPQTEERVIIANPSVQLGPKIILVPKVLPDSPNKTKNSVENVPKSRFKCPSCPCIFRTQTELSSHNHIVHSRKLAPTVKVPSASTSRIVVPSTSTTTSDAKATHKCRHCSFSTPYKGNLIGNNTTAIICLFRND
jgi:hypothetical protein